MAVASSVDHAGWAAEQISACEPDVLRSIAEAPMSAEADAECGADYGTRSDGG